MRNRIEAIEYAMNLFNELIDCGFDPSQPNSISLINLPSDIEWASGATRVVVWRIGADYVIKFGWDAGDEKYCAREYEIYRDAVKFGVSDYFGWCERAIEPENNYGIGVYVMEYLNCDEETIDDSSFELAFHNYCEENGVEENSDSREDFSEWYWESDESTDTPLEYFLNEIKDCAKRHDVDEFVCNEDISDLHAGNFGYRDDTLVICDYASYGW